MKGASRFFFYVLYEAVLFCFCFPTISRSMGDEAVLFLFLFLRFRAMVYGAVIFFFFFSYATTISGSLVRAVDVPGESLSGWEFADSKPSEETPVDSKLPAENLGSSTAGKAAEEVCPGAGVELVGSESSEALKPWFGEDAAAAGSKAPPQLISLKPFQDNLGNFGDKVAGGIGVFGDKVVGVAENVGGGFVGLFGRFEQAFRMD